MLSKGIPAPHEDYRVKRAVQFMLKYEALAWGNPAPAADVDIPGA